MPFIRLKFAIFNNNIRCSSQIFSRFSGGCRRYPESFPDRFIRFYLDISSMNLLFYNGHYINIFLSRCFIHWPDWGRKGRARDLHPG